ncbi:AGAMOUS-like 101 [Euphorbia peplus]|nr:AGAMOUS-like 101 [Euphorbia peplus]
MDSPAKKRARSGMERGEKEARKANFLKKIFNGDQAAKSSSLAKRKPTLMKKAMELQTLCGIDVSIVCFDPDGNVDIWPEDESEVKKRCTSYLALDKKAKNELTCCQYLEHKKKKILKKKDKSKAKDIDMVISGLSDWIEGKSGAELRDSVSVLEAKIKIFKQRIELLKIRQQQQKEEVKEEMDDKKDYFSHLSDIQLLQGSAPTPTGYYINPDDSSWMMNNNHYFVHQNSNQMLNGVNNGMNGVNNADYDNYNYNYMAYEQMIAESSNSHSVSTQTSPATSTSIYDVMPISQCPSNFGNYSSTDNYFF